jgi:hypothetical protein
LEADLDVNEISEWIITENTTIDYDFYAQQNIIVESGILTIKDTLFMPQNGRIIVKQGALLKVDGGTITNGCDRLWEGIEVWGDASASQNFINQGGVILVNNATIENAQTAIKLWEPGNWGATGGIVYSSNASFINNKRAVEFINYQNFNPLTDAPNGNISYFSNTKFTWNDNFKYPYPLGHITLYKVDGVDIQGCEFTDERSNPVSRYLTTGGYTNVGIRSIDANYNIRAKCDDIAGCTGYIDSADWTPTTFTNLDFGLYAANSNTEHNITVDRSIFSNNLYGVVLANVNNASINRNQFTYTNTANNFTGTTQYGVHLIRSQGIEVEENNFNNISAPNRVNGIVSSALGESDEEIYKNIFTNLYAGNVTQGKNRLIDPDGILSGKLGLQFLCNTNSDNLRDHLVLNSLWGEEVPYAGVKNDNGFVDLASGNVFTQASAFAAEDYDNDAPSTVRYYYFTDSTNQEPFDYEGLFNKTFTIQENYCNSRLTENPYQHYNDNFSHISQGKADFENTETELLAKENEYIGLVNGGNTDSLLTEIGNLTSGNRATLRQTLLSFSPYLTEEVVRATIDNTTDKYPHTWSMELVLANIEVAYQPGFIDFLSTKTAPLPAWMINDIQEEVDSNATTLHSTKRSAIALLQYEKAGYANDILKHYKNDTTALQMDSVRQWIDNKGDLLGITRTIDTYIHAADYSAASTLVNNIVVNNYPLHLQDELDDFISFKTKTIAILSDSGHFANLDTTDYNFMVDMADNGKGIAQLQAQEILCFFYDVCAVRPIALPSEQNPQGPAQAMDLPAEVKEESSQFAVYPNPAKDWASIVLPEKGFLEYDAEFQVTLTDLQGHHIYTKYTRRSLLILETYNLSSGTYIVRVFNTKTNENYGTEKLIIQQ